jgi:hypothetical protein
MIHNICEEWKWKYLKKLARQMKRVGVMEANSFFKFRGGFLRMVWEGGTPENQMTRGCSQKLEIPLSIFLFFSKFSNNLNTEFKFTYPHFSGFLLNCLKN